MKWPEHALKTFDELLAYTGNIYFSCPESGYSVRGSGDPSICILPTSPAMLKRDGENKRYIRLSVEWEHPGLHRSLTIDPEIFSKTGYLAVPLGDMLNEPIFTNYWHAYAWVLKNKKVKS